MKLSSLAGLLPHLLFPFLVFLGGCCFGPSSAVIKLGYEAGFSPSDMVLSQYVFGCLFMLILAAVYFVITHIRKSRKQKVTYTVKDVILFIVIGILIAMVSLTYMMSLQRVPAHLAVILLFQYTWIGIIIESLIKRKLPELPTVISAGILIGATFLASGFGSISLADIDPLGVLFGMLSALCYALYILFIGKLNPKISPVYRSVITLAIALALLVIIFTPYYFSPEFIKTSVIDGNLWMFGLVIGSLGCAMPNFLFSIAVPKVPGDLATILSSSELPASIICAVIIISESVTPLQWVGVLLLFFGIAFPYLVKVSKMRRLFHSKV
ncbi:MAG TPA: DMT family transporter [Methanocorpusculum sp.]|nr:DMT family transporter [Methanocorpusculum sp.]